MMEPKIYHNPMDKFSQKPQKEFEKMFKNLIYILFVALLCVVVSLGLVLSLNIYPGECAVLKRTTRNSNSTPLPDNSYHFNSMKLVQPDYTWPDNVVKIVEDVLDYNMHITNDDRAVLIKSELMKLKTNDVFYIMVYNHTQSPTSVVIYRSHYWRGSPENALTTVTKEETCSKGINSTSEDFTDIPRELYKNFHDINFLGIIDKKLDVSVRSGNSFGREWGPGYWDTIPVFDSKTKKRTGKEFILIAGYK
ncbi:unnamed protein product [Caenorhabditis brenneri]